MISLPIFSLLSYFILIPGNATATGSSSDVLPTFDTDPQVILGEDNETDAEDIKQWLRDAAIYLQHHKYCGSPNEAYKYTSQAGNNTGYDNLLLQVSCKEEPYSCVRFFRSYLVQSDIIEKLNVIRGKFPLEQKSIFVGHIPFPNYEEQARFRDLLSKYMCKHALAGHPQLSFMYFPEGSCGELLEIDDYRKWDANPFDCAIMSFCPDPCCGKGRPVSTVRECMNDKDRNPCFEMAPKNMCTFGMTDFDDFLNTGILPTECVEGICPHNKTYQAASKDCVNDNECQLGEKNRCDPSSTTCEDTETGYTCKCINNTVLVGGYKCQRCPFGFSFINGTCVDVDECKMKLGKCFFPLVCSNTKGGYECLCPKNLKVQILGNNATCVPKLIKSFMPTLKSSRGSKLRVCAMWLILLLYSQGIVLGGWQIYWL